MERGKSYIRLADYLRRTGNCDDIFMDIHENIISHSQDDIVIEFTDVDYVGDNEVVLLIALFKLMSARGRAVFIKRIRPKDLAYLKTKMRLGLPPDDDYQPQHAIPRRPRGDLDLGAMEAEPDE